MHREIKSQFSFFNRSGGRLKERMKKIIFITLTGFGGYYAIRGYRRYRWFSEMNDSDEKIGSKPRIVVLGTG